MRVLQLLRVSWIILIAGFCTPTPSPAEVKLPGDSAQLLPVLKREIDTYWYKLSIREFPAGVVDQESNWKIAAKLKTKREFGCGLGQHTIAYNADGSVRFDAIAETRRLDPSLSGWTWQDCYNTTYQLRGTVLKLKLNNRDCEVTMANATEALKCSAAKYNGGAGSVTKRIRLCRAKPGCDPKIWEGNLNSQCAQSNVKQEGYGESFCEINAKYPGRVFTRMPKFKGKL